MSTSTSGAGERSRLLVLRALGLGEFLTAVPSLRALRAAYPDHEIVLATPRALEPVARLAEVADHLLDTRGLVQPAWSGAPPDLAVNLHDRGPLSHRLLTACSPGRLVAFGCADAGHEGPEWRDDEPDVLRWCRLLEEQLGLRTDPDDRLLAAPDVPAPVPGAVVIHPGPMSESPWRPASAFSAVARCAADRGHRVVVTGGPGEQRLAEAVRKGAGLEPSTVLAGNLGLVELAAQVASACLVVTGDAEAELLASAYRRPTVILDGSNPIGTVLAGVERSLSEVRAERGRAVV